MWTLHVQISKNKESTEHQDMPQKLHSQMRHEKICNFTDSLNKIHGYKESENKNLYQRRGNAERLVGGGVSPSAVCDSYDNDDGWWIISSDGRKQRFLKTIFFLGLQGLEKVLLSFFSWVWNSDWRTVLRYSKTSSLQRSLFRRPLHAFHAVSSLFFVDGCVMRKIRQRQQQCKQRLQVGAVRTTSSCHWKYRA